MSYYGRLINDYKSDSINEIALETIFISLMAALAGGSWIAIVVYAAKKIKLDSDIKKWYAKKYDIPLLSDKEMKKEKIKYDTNEETRKFCKGYGDYIYYYTYKGKPFLAYTYISSGGGDYITSKYNFSFIDNKAKTHMNFYKLLILPGGNPELQGWANDIAKEYKEEKNKK